MISRKSIAVESDDIQITEESLDRLAGIWESGEPVLAWNCLFTLPVWMKAWLGSCRAEFKTSVLAVRRKDRLLGLAPLMVSGSEARLIGSPDLCDYLDFTVASGQEGDFFKALLLHLAGQKIQRLDLGPLRIDSTAFRDLRAVARQMGWEDAQVDDEVSFEMALPGAWEEYLAGLKSKQRHEVRRKLRRLSENAHFELRLVETPDQVSAHFDTFLDLFRQSRADKSEFLTEERLGFFQHLTTIMANAGMLRLYFLDIESRPAACALCFEYADTLFLYNSGYDPQFAALSAGQVCTFLTIKAGIAKGLKRYNFLKGNEAYKKRLGGGPVQLVRLTLTK